MRRKMQNYILSKASGMKGIFLILRTEKFSKF